jgi:hypothetical protein
MNLGSPSNAYSPIRVEPPTPNSSFTRSASRFWHASSWNEAFRLAEAEAQEYANSDDCIFHFATDAFHLFDETVGHGTEVWSTMRGSGMDAKTYKTTFCATPLDRIGDHR